MSFLRTPREGAFGPVSCFSAGGQGQAEQKRPKVTARLPPPKPQGFYKVQAGSEWGRCILSPVPWAGILVSQPLSPSSSSRPSPAMDGSRDPGRATGWVPQIPTGSVSTCMCECMFMRLTHLSVQV